MAGCLTHTLHSESSDLIVSQWHDRGGGDGELVICSHEVFSNPVLLTLVLKRGGGGGRGERERWRISKLT